ncbi:MAG: ImmA/IrrE family metallo-endopeptidase [Armatimonadota bacterium]
MSQTLGSQPRCRRIADAIHCVYADAGLAPTAGRPGATRLIVPLYELINAYPLRVAEIRNLTYGSAREFLLTETQQEVPVPENSGCPLAGFLYIYRYAGFFYGCVLLEQGDPVSRRRFSAAHELGHYLLHFLPLLRELEGQAARPCVITEGLAVSADPDAAPPVGEVRFTESFGAAATQPVLDREVMEDEANEFAAELLMPEPAVRLMADRYRRETGARRQVLARRLAPEFLVSRQAMIRRLETLGLPTAQRVPGTVGSGLAGE